jgi:DNA-binding NarL/FixJ family response regulator
MARAKSANRPSAEKIPERPAAPSPPAKLRTVVIEDETMFRQLIVATLGTIHDIEIVGAFGTGQPGLDFCLRERVDLLVVDLLLPDIEGLEIARQVRQASEDVIILVVTAHPSERLPSKLLALGVAGYVDKNESIEYVVNAIATLRRGGMFFASTVKAERGRPVPVLSRTAVKQVALTEREQQIARLVAAGKMSKEIAVMLNLSHRTVENHRASIMQKIGIRDVASLTRWCIETGLLYSEP